MRERDTNLGILYMNGQGVAQDYAEAARQFRVAAERGETGAMVDLGFLSDSGLGMPQDKATAAEWYRLAAERGDALGQNNLADMYLRGEGVAQSDALAREWFEKAAAQGNTGARIKLGYFVCERARGTTGCGEGVCVDFGGTDGGRFEGEGIFGAAGEGVDGGAVWPCEGEGAGIVVEAGTSENGAGVFALEIALSILACRGTKEGCPQRLKPFSFSVVTARLKPCHDAVEAVTHTLTKSFFKHG